jgi:hypothetical protein
VVTLEKSSGLEVAVGGEVEEIFPIGKAEAIELAKGKVVSFETKEGQITKLFRGERDVANCRMAAY